MTELERLQMSKTWTDELLALEPEPDEAAVERELVDTWEEASS